VLEELSWLKVVIRYLFRGTKEKQLKMFWPAEVVGLDSCKRANGV